MAMFESMSVMTVSVSVSMMTVFVDWGSFDYWGSLDNWRCIDTVSSVSMSVSVSTMTISLMMMSVTLVVNWNFSYSRNVRNMFGYSVNSWSFLNDSVESVNWVSSVMNSSGTSISLNERILTLHNSTISRFMLTLNISSVMIIHSV
jgi:hypothetical protein